jgi:hypothetical protein
MNAQSDLKRLNRSESSEAHQKASIHHNSRARSKAAKASFCRQLFGSHRCTKTPTDMGVDVLINGQVEAR